MQIDFPNMELAMERNVSSEPAPTATNDENEPSSAGESNQAESFKQETSKQ